MEKTVKTDRRPFSMNDARISEVWVVDPFSIYVEGSRGEMEDVVD